MIFRAGFVTKTWIYLVYPPHPPPPAGLMSWICCVSRKIKRPPEVWSQLQVGAAVEPEDGDGKEEVTRTRTRTRTELGRGFSVAMSTPGGGYITFFVKAAPSDYIFAR